MAPPESVYPVLQLGWHVLFEAKELPHEPMPPWSGAETEHAASSTMGERVPFMDIYGLAS